MEKVIPSLKLALLCCKASQTSSATGPRRQPHLLHSSEALAATQERQECVLAGGVDPLRLSSDAGSRAEFGKQLSAMLKTSGNWLRSCGESHPAFLRPISLD